MRRIGNCALTQVILLLSAFVVMVSFSIPKEPLPAMGSAVEKPHELVEVVNQFQQRPSEPALSKKADDTTLSNLGMDYGRYFVFLGVSGVCYALYFSHLKIGLKNCSFDRKNAIPIKLRI